MYDKIPLDANIINNFAHINFSDDRRQLSK